MISNSGNAVVDRSKYLLLTGATGFLGRYLLRDLLLEGHRVAVIVRPTQKKSAQQRIDEILAEWEEQLGQLLPRPVVLAGNLAQANCGLTATSRKWIHRHCDRMLHSAAVLRFHANDHQDEPWLTNVCGTKNVIALCEESGIREFHSVSTAYVCGDRPDLILENELDVGQTFRNDYEKSKFEAEKLIRSATCFDSVTIYRPAVISGDSVTGYTSSYHGLYVYLRLMAILVPAVEPDENGIRHTEMMLPMNGDEPRNIVPVDWVSEVICHLLEQPETHGKTFHLSPDKMCTPKKVVEYGCSYFNSTGVAYEQDQRRDGALGTDFETKFLENIRQYESYDHTDPRFDRSNLLKHAAHLPCPEIDERVLHRYLRFGEEDRWGKRKAKKRSLTKDVHEHLEQLCDNDQTLFAIEDLSLRVSRMDDAELAANGHSSKKTPIAKASSNSDGRILVLGLDLLGPGGGQWHLVGNPNRGYAVRRGLPGDSAPVLHLPTCEFRQLIERQREPDREHYLNIHEPADFEHFDRIVFGVVQSIVSAPAC